MIYIYNDYGGTHTTVLAAAFHLKKLDESRAPTNDEMKNLPFFNKLDYQDQGTLFFHGTDESGNPVYTVARGRSKILIPGLCSLIQMLHKERGLEEKLIFSNTSPTVPPLLTLGGFTSRGLKLKALGDPLVLAGARQACPNIIQLVRLTKQTAEQSPLQLVVLENKAFQYRVFRR
jgi:hypothetical protein